MGRKKSIRCCFCSLYFRTCYLYKIIFTKAKIGHFFLHRRNSDAGQKARMEWHKNSTHYHTRASKQLGLKKDKTLHKNTRLLAPRCWAMKQIGICFHFHQFPFVLWKKRRTFSLAFWLPLAHLSVFKTALPQVFFCYFLLNNPGHFKAAVPLPFQTVCNGICCDTALLHLHAKTCLPAPKIQHQTLLKRCQYETQRHEKGIHRQEHGVIKHERQWAYGVVGFLWHSFLYLKNSWFGE